MAHRAQRIEGMQSMEEEAGVSESGVTAHASRHEPHGCRRTILPEHEVRGDIGDAAAQC